MNKIAFFIVMIIFILLNRGKPTELLYVEQLSSIYPYLLPEMPRYCRLFEILYFVFIRDMTEILELLAKAAKQRRVSFPRTHQSSAGRF